MKQQTHREAITSFLKNAYERGRSVEDIQQLLHERTGSEHSVTEVLSHIKHINKSLTHDDNFELLIAPPECFECGFDSFDDTLNNPSKCPQCRSERILNPKFKIEESA